MNTNHPAQPMSDSTRPHPDEEAAARLTAQALGQLAGQECDDAVARLAEGDTAEVRQVVTETKRVADALQVARTADLVDTTNLGRSPELRRAVIARLATPATLPVGIPSPSASPRSSTNPLRRAPWGLLAAAGSVAAAVLVAATVLVERPGALRGPDLRSHPVAPVPVTQLDGAADTSLPSTTRAERAKQADKRSLALRAAPTPTAADVAEIDATPAFASREQPASQVPEKAGASAVSDEAQARGAEGQGIEYSARPMLAATNEQRSSAAPGMPMEANPRAEQLADAFTVAKAGRDRELPDDGLQEPQTREQYARFAENAIRRVADAPLSTFGVDVDTASYAIIRRFLSGGRLPPRDAVRLEECVNYFRYDDALPEGDDPFAVTLESATCPWNEDRLLVRIGIRGRDVARAFATPTIAKDVKLQVEFNPARVASYRLLGYENRLLAARDFRDDRKDAGDIGAGHTVTALYEIALAGGPAGDTSGVEPLTYQRQPQPAPVATVAVPSDDLLTVTLRFKQPDGDTSTLREYPLADAGGRFENASADLRFAAAVAGFALILRDSDHVGGLTLDDVARIASRSLGRDEGGYRAEFIDLVRKAAHLRPMPSTTRRAAAEGE